MTENVFERVLRIAAEEREARQTRPMSAALIAAAEQHRTMHRADYLSGDVAEEIDV